MLRRPPSLVRIAVEPPFFDLLSSYLEHRFMVDATMPPHSHHTALTASAPAKINLTLQVHGRRDDGYHTLSSLVVGCALFDDLRFSASDDPGVYLSCDDPGLPADRHNLVNRAAAALAQHVDRPPGVSIELRKRIPLAAGLGGGSSDCATTLRTLNTLWNVGLTDGELARIGAQLGSDVPLFFSLPVALIGGRGEQVQPVVLRWSGWVVLAMGGWPVLSRQVFANWRPADRGPRDPGALDTLLSGTSASALSPLLVNELEPAVFRTEPAVRDFQSALVESSGHRWRISGAGSTAFALFDHEPEARRVAEMIHQHGLAKRVALVRTLNGPTDEQLCEEAATWTFPKSASS